MRREQFLRRAFGVTLAITALDGAQLGRLLNDPVRDDTWLLQQFVDRGGGTIYFPPGRYVLSRPLRLREDHHHIIGAGSHKTVLVASPNFPADMSLFEAA